MEKTTTWIYVSVSKDACQIICFFSASLILKYMFIENLIILYLVKYVVDCDRISGVVDRITHPVVMICNEQKTKWRTTYDISNGFQVTHINSISCMVFPIYFTQLFANGTSYIKSHGVCGNEIIFANGWHSQVKLALYQLRLCHNCVLFRIKKRLR